MRKMQYKAQRTKYSLRPNFYRNTCVRFFDKTDKTGKSMRDAVI